MKIVAIVFLIIVVMFGLPIMLTFYEKYLDKLSDKYTSNKANLFGILIAAVLIAAIIFLVELSMYLVNFGS